MGVLLRGKWTNKKQHTLFLWGNRTQLQSCGFDWTHQSNGRIATNRLGCWHRISYLEIRWRSMNRPRTRLRKVSKARAVQMRLYTKLKKAHLKDHEICFCCGYWLEPAGRDLHHFRGRTHGLLCWTPGFRTVCRECHTKIHDNPKWALNNRLIAGTKEWGVMPK